MVELVRERMEEISALCERCNVAELFLFGSGANERFDPVTSDLDFAVLFKPMDFREHGKSYFALLFGLEDLLGKPVDLVTLDSIRNPHILESVEAERQLLYAA